MAKLERELQAYEAMKASLEKHHMGKWIVVHDDELVGAFDTLTEILGGVFWRPRESLMRDERRSRA